MSEEKIGDIILKDIVASDDKWHEADALASKYGVEKQCMKVMLENWAQLEILEWGGGGRVRLGCP